MVVVLGILIATQVSNWYSEKKTNTLFLSALKAAQLESHQNIKFIEQYMGGDEITQQGTIVFDALFNCENSSAFDNTLNKLIFNLNHSYHPGTTLESANNLKSESYQSNVSDELFNKIQLLNAIQNNGK